LSKAQVTVAGSITVEDRMDVGGESSFYGAVEMSATLGVDGSTTLRSDLAVLKDAGIGGGLEVDGATALHDTAVAGTLAVTDATALSSTLGVTGDVTVGTSKFTVVASSGNTGVAGKLAVAGITTLAEDLRLSEDAAALTHTGTTGLAITSTGGFVDVEDVRFTGAAIGISVDTDILTLSSGTVTVAGETVTTSLDVNGVADISGTLTLSGATHDVTHTGTTGLAITSTSGYVDVEDVRFTGASIGLSGDTDLVTLSEAQVTVAGSVTIEDRVDVGGKSNFYGAVEMAGTLGVDGDTRLRSHLAVLKDAGIGGVLEVEGGTALHNTAVAGTLDVALATTLAALSADATSLKSTLGVAG
jgi:hypothetical protein